MLTGLIIAGCLAGLLWGAYRLTNPSTMDRAAKGFAEMYGTLPTGTRKLLDVAGYGSHERLVCRANFDGALVFSNRVMELHPELEYRFRRRQANLWVFLPKVPFQILVPDNDAVRAVLAETDVTVTAREQINSRGCRGPEWEDYQAYDFRVLVVGDSFTEGIMVSEEQTFCTRLQWHLQERSGLKVLVANAGVIGYSTEQEFHTICELAPEMKPDLIVLCFYANDVHRDHQKVLLSKRPVGDWEEARKWLKRCANYSAMSGALFLVVVLPDQSQAQSRIGRTHYQHRLEQIASDQGFYLIDPYDRFLSNRDKALYLEKDAHLAPAGHELLAQVLADHVMVWMPAR
jgi:lysophospholipase L1-like esterase